MGGWKDFSALRREYGELTLSVETAHVSPFEQFEIWFEEVLKTEKSDPTAMVLSTVDESGFPDSRVVLLKEIRDETFIFYTNYQSEKAKQIATNAQVALTFYWPEMARQVRIKGKAFKTSIEKSDAYFNSRPKSSQIGAIVSPQSAVIASRADLEAAFNKLINQNQQEPVVRPLHWGGYAVTPHVFEFWQGRDNRLHDRVQYLLHNHNWIRNRLAP